MSKCAILSLPPERWREAKRLRLQALRAEPAAFASCYDEEVAFADDVWIARLSSAFDRAGNLTLYAEADGVLIGMVGAGWSAKAKLRHVAEVYGVYVAREQRGRGIGSQLMRALLGELRSQEGIEKVGLEVNAESLAALRLYEQLGFKTVGRSRRALKVDRRYFDLTIMELHIAS